MTSLIREFSEFLSEYKATGLIVAFIIGGAVTSLSQSLTDNVVMPVVTFFMPSGAWQTAAVSFGPITIGWGAVLNSLIDFTILSMVVFMLVKFMPRVRKR